MVPEATARPEVELDVPGRLARRSDRVIGLTPREWVVIEALLLPNCSIWAESELVAYLAHRGMESSPNAVRIHLCHIRRKLGWDVIQTLPGRGYRVTLPGKERSARLDDLRGGPARGPR